MAPPTFAHDRDIHFLAQDEELNQVEFCRKFTEELF